MVVQAHISKVRLAKNSHVDVRVSFSIPSGVYLDVFELYVSNDSVLLWIGCVVLINRIIFMLGSPRLWLEFCIHTYGVERCGL